MIRADVFDKIDKILQVVNNNYLLFGGKQIILFGDLFQLPPIAKREEEILLKRKYGGIYFFQSYAYKCGNFRFIDLQINHRQKNDILYFQILNRIREGEVTDDDIIHINSKAINNPIDTRKILKLFPTKADVEYTNKYELDKIPLPEFCYYAEILYNGRQNQNIAIEQDFPIKNELILKEGALIMMVRNDERKRWVNGTFGIVSKLYPYMITVNIDGIEYNIFREKFEAREAVYENGRIFYKTILEVSQFPLVLAYAITIHKSQGMTYNQVACDLSRCFAAGQAYVALSRCSSLNGLKLLHRITKTEIKFDNDVKTFYLNQKKVSFINDETNLLLNSTN